MPVLQSAQNLGRLINNIVGIQGIAPGAQATINMPVNQRVHRLNFQCTAIAFDPATTVEPPSAGNGDAVLTPTIVNGVITAITITAGGTGYTNGTGLDAVIKDGVYGTNLFNASIKLTIAGGTVTVATLVSGGTVSPCPAERFFTSIKHLVGGTIMRDIGAADVLGIAAFNNLLPFLATRRGGTFGLVAAAAGVAPRAGPPFTTLGAVGASQMGLPNVIGQLPVYMTEPWRKIVNHDAASSWDLFGQSTYQILLGIASGITSPGLVGSYEFDYLRNQTVVRDRSGKGVQSYFLKPVKQHAFSFNVPVGLYDITTLPVTFPIQRLYFYGPAQPYQIELYQDGNKILEGTAEQVMQMYRDYGFNTDVYDLAYISDVDQRFDRALKVQRTLDVRIWNTNAAQLTVVMESTPPAYA
jgi:hypothetical protein